jgi:hypothetical protein
VVKTCLSSAPAGRERVRRSAHETGNRPARPQKPPQFGAIWCKKQPPAQQAGKMAYSAQRAQRFTPRTPPGAGWAAPTAFQRTSLLMKCNTEDGDCKSFFPADYADHAEENERKAASGRNQNPLAPGIRAEKNISWGSGSRPDRHSVATADEGEPSQL